VLLMDEPTSALDPEARRSLEHTARRLADAGRQLVWVTHDLDQARRLGGDIVVLVGGRIAGDAERARFLADVWPTDAPAASGDRNGGDDDG
jgi:ABC-type proline/glycine betaine transport system ATPase subunit